MSRAKPLRRRSRSAASATVRTASQVRHRGLALNSELARVALAAVATPAPEPEPDSNLTVGELWLYGLVGGWWRGFDAESVANAIRGMDVDVLYVRIHSPGGRAQEGIAIANLLRNLDAKVVTVVDGYACSAASVIAVAGDEVVICPGAQLMIHDASTGMCVWGDAEWLREQVTELDRVANWIDGQSQNYAGIYAYKAGNTPEFWRGEMTVNGQMGKWYTGEEAVAAGLADRVGTVVAVGSPPVAPEDEIDEDDEDMLARVAHDLQLLEECVSSDALAAWIGDPNKPPPARPREGTPTRTEREAAMAFTPEQLTKMRQELGLAEDADEATIAAALSEALAEQAEAPAAPTTLEAPEGFSLVDNETLAAMRSGAEAGQAARTQQLTEHRDRTIATAISQGKFPPGRQEHYEAAWDADAAGTEDLIGRLAPGLVPVEERGHALIPTEETTSTVNDASLDSFAGSLGLTKEDLRG